MSPCTLQLYVALTEDANLVQVLAQHHTLVPYDPVLARIYHRLSGLCPFSSQEVRRVIVEETEEREAAHFLAVPEATPPAELHRDLLTGLRTTYKESGLALLGDFGEQVEDWDTLSLSVIWTQDHLCKAGTSRVVSPGTACSSDVSQLRSKSGLRPLAARVKDLVQAIGPKACYQTVAEGLVSDFDLPNSQILREKAVKNIKRRAYDAINIMTAVGILTKHEETLAVAFPSEDIALIQAKSRISAKKHHLKTLSSSYQLLKSLFSRNEKHQMAAQMRISLPFLVLATADRSDSTVISTQLRVRTDPCNQYVEIRSSHAFNLLGDINALQRLRLPRVAALPEDLSSLCS